MNTLFSSRAAINHDSRAFAAAKVCSLHILAAFFGFILARTDIFDDYIPFGAAFAAAVPGEYIPAAALGSVFGYLVPVTGGNGFRYIASIVLCAVIRFFITGIIRPARQTVVSSCVIFASLGITGVILTFSAGLSPSDALVFAAEGLLAAGASFFFGKSLELASDGKKLGAYSSQELTALLISAAIIILAFSEFKVFSVSPARVVMLIAVLAAARYGHEPAGAIAGIAAGLVMSLTPGNYWFAAAGFALGGLMAGVFSLTGRFGCSTAFILSNSIAALSSIDNPNLIPVLYEVMAATVIFVALPRRVGAMLGEVFTPSTVNAPPDGLRDSIVMRLKFASGALNDVSKTVDTVAAKLKKAAVPDFESVFEKTEREVCLHCSMRIYCWETERGTTLSALLDATSQMRKITSYKKIEFPDKFSRKCTRLESLTESLGKNFNNYLSRQQAETRVGEIRTVLSQQFEGLSDMLNSLGEEFEDSEKYDSEASENVAASLRAAGITSSDVICRTDKFGRMTVETRMPTPDERINRSVLTRELSEICGRDFDVPCVSQASGYTMLTLSEKAVYSVDVGVAQITCEKYTLCGDACNSFVDGRGHFVMVLSDGMGSGGRAAVDGAMAAGLMSKLIKAGFGHDCALKIVNSAMLFKSSDESLATIDITSIDLFTGYTEFYKAGAPETMIRRGGKAGSATGSAFPAGILRDVEFDKTGLTLSDGDIILMLSDGALDDGSDWIGVELEVWRNGTASQLAGHIADFAHRRAASGHNDDITVMAAIIRKNQF